jgi:hypothetical protein
MALLLLRSFDARQILPACCGIRGSQANLGINGWNFAAFLELGDANQHLQMRKPASVTDIVTFHSISNSTI